MNDLDDEFQSDVEGGEETLLEEGEEEKQIEAYPLTQDTLNQGLSVLCRTGKGLGHAFVKLDLNEKQLNDITVISSYIHIRFLDVSNNQLTDLSPLESLTQLLWLKVDNNAVSCFKGQPFANLTYLQWLSMAGNKLTELDDFVGPALENLNLAGNGIMNMTGFQSMSFDNLVSLELRGNKLETTEGINLPNLQRLYLAQNTIKHLEGLEMLHSLKILHLRDNQLESLEGLSPDMKCLEYFNVRGNSIPDEAALQSLGHVSNSLRVIVLSENPLEDLSDYRLNVLKILPQLERIDKEAVSQEEREIVMEMNEAEMLELED